MATGARWTVIVVRVVTVAVTLLAAAAPSEAADNTVFLAPFSGSQETPPVTTNAGGGALVLLDNATNKINWIVDHKGINPTAAHFHGNGFPGTAAPIIIDIAAMSGGLTSPMVGSTTLTAQQAADLLAGRWYINVHSTTYPDGEIRGQLAALFTAPLVLFPGIAPLARTTGFDLTLFLDAGLTPVSGSVTLNGTDVTSFFLACVKPGTLTGGNGRTFRCPVAAGLLGPGEYFVSVILNLSDGTSVGSTANWSVEANTEP